MPTKKARQKLMKHRICLVSRVVACASFLILTIIAVSSLVRAMSLENIANEYGVPASWETASLGNPDTITVPISYWDQRQDDCNDPTRQFEWVICGYWTAGALQGLVKDHLGTDGLPIPAFTNNSDSWNANRDVFTANITGNDPVQSNDNFYRWFHDTSVSKRYDREVTFTRTGKNTYTYGATNVFPLDDVDFSDGDSAWDDGHNFHFTAHLNFATKITADGSELFEFSGDDDVWVFLNGRLVLDIGGLHEKLDGWFKINADGTVSTYVQNVNDTGARVALGEPSNDFNSYVGPFNELIRQNFHDKYETIDVGLKPGDVVNLDFFYAERSTVESNTKITISNMHWPISADSNIDAEIVGKLPEHNSNLVRFNTSITNRDPDHPLDLERLAAYVDENEKDESGTANRSGFLPLDETTLYYTKTPEDENSWQPVKISAPSETTDGFNLETPIRMTPNGTTGDTLYFRYYGETSAYSGNMTSLVSYYTTMEGNAGVTYDYATVEYEAPIVDEQSYNLTIKYLYEDESEAAPTYHATLKTGDGFDIDSPEIADYKADINLVSGVIEKSDLTYIVHYKKLPTEEIPTTRPTLTIHYIYEDGQKAADDYIEELDAGSEFNVTSPEIDDYTPDYTNVKGKIENDDLEYIVRYKKIPTPVPQPEVPTTPAPSNNPPFIPPSNVIDGKLLYLAPLGEIAFVPNTGVIGTTMASVFEQGFADIILSQGFIMVMLTIFAGSFATYFTLRRFINLQPATAKVSTNNKSSAKSRKKSYAKMTKARAKTTKKAVKNTKTTKKK